MGRFQELEPAELHKRNIAAGQFDFERPTVMRGPEQDRLLLQRRTTFAVFQYTLDDVTGLVGLVADADQERAFGRNPVCPKRFLVKRSAARSMTPLAAARIGCVER